MSRAIRDILNEASPGKVADAMRELPMGEALALVPRTFRGTVVSNVLVLPEDSKAIAVLAAYAIAGSVTGRLTPVRIEATVATTQCAPNAGGDVAFFGTDAVTEAEVVYLAFEGTVFEDLIPVASNQGTLLGSRSAQVILEVEALAGTATGVFTPVARGTTPVTTQAAINDDPTLIDFAAADAVTSARVKYIAQPGQGDAAGPVGTELDAEDKAY